MVETADAQWVKSLVRQLTKCLGAANFKKPSLKGKCTHASVICTLNKAFLILSMTSCIHSADHLGPRHNINHWCTLHLRSVNIVLTEAVLQICH